MRVGLLGKKLGMTQVFDEEGRMIPVTVVEAGPCVILRKRTPDRDGYAALQLGFGEKKAKHVTKPEAGQFELAGTSPKRFVREIRISEGELEEFQEKQVLSVDLFKPKEFVDVAGTSKGRGFAGVVKRWHFQGFVASHGTHEYFRHGGSIGMNMTPARVFKNKKMPGRMGGERVSVQNLRVVRVDPERNLLFLKGAVPGWRNSFVIIRKAVKKN